MQTGEIVSTKTERVVFGKPAHDAIAIEAEKRDARRVFLLVSKHLDTKTDEIDKIRQALHDRLAGSHHGIRPHGPKSDLLEATARARDLGADLIVTVGGGSLTDAGKILSVCLKHDIKDLEGLEAIRCQYDADGKIAPPTFAGPDVRVVAVPTTLSGGEFNPLAGAKDEQLEKKQGFMHPGMAPAVVVLDPAITVHTPEWLWISTGVRAIDHAVETLGSYRSNDFCDGMADSALRLLGEGLPRVKKDALDLEGRLKCQIGAWQSMIPMISGVPMGASHAIGHALGAVCGTPHGYTSCVMSPYVQAWNAEVNGDRQKRISLCLGAPNKSPGELLDMLISNLGMPRHLEQIDVREEHLQKIAEHTLHDIWGGTNPRPIKSKDDVITILKSAFRGTQS